MSIGHYRLQPCIIAIVSLALQTFVHAEDDKLKDLVAEASKACDALPKTRRPSMEAKQAWLNLAQAKVNLGDTEGGIAALDRVNSEHDYSICSAWVMATEATGKTQPDPKEVDEQVLMVHRVGVVRSLIALADYDAALAQAMLLPPGEARDLSVTRCHIESAQAQHKDGQVEAALKNYNEAITSSQKIKTAKSAIPCILDIGRGLIDCDLAVAATPLLDNLEEALKKQPASAQNSTTIKTWLQIGQLRLLLGDVASAKQNFENAKALYTKVGEPQTGVAWNRSPFPTYQHRFRWEAYRQLKATKEASQALHDWSAAIANLDEEFSSPDQHGALVEALLLAGSTDAAQELLDGLDAPVRAMTFMQVRRSPESMDSKTVNLALAKYSEQQFRDGPESALRPGALTIACECYAKAGERDKFLACFQEALQLSEDKDRENHAALAALLVEMEETDEARKVIDTLKGHERALA